MPLNGGYVNVDVSEATEKLKILQQLLSEKSFQKVLYRTLGDTAKYVKTIVGKETAKKYNTTQKDAKADVQSYSIGYGDINGLNVMVHCSIPVQGVKGVIGGRFSASGGTGKPKKGKRQIIKAKIVRSGISTLPPTLPNQGGNPPFRAPKSKVVFTRRTANRLPIVRVVALGTPQFPLNRSKDDVTDAIIDRMEQRLDHYAERELGFKL